MTRLAGISGRQTIKKLKKAGYRVVRQRGSHVRLNHTDSIEHQPITVPNVRELKIGLLVKIIKDAGLNVDGFLWIYNKLIQNKKFLRNARGSLCYLQSSVPAGFDLGSTTMIGNTGSPAHVLEVETIWRMVWPPSAKSRMASMGEWLLHE